MGKIFYYSDFILEKEFNLLLTDIFKIIESKGKWTSPNTIEWDYENDNVSNTWLIKLKKFIEKLPKEKIKEYYVKLINSIKNMPNLIRKKLIIIITGVFLTFTSLSYLISPATSITNPSGELSNQQIKEIIELNKKTKKASFKKAQEHVKIVEAGYSNDKKDEGNWIKLNNGEKRFIGTKYGISAPVLQKFLNRIPTQDDMINLSYETALEIYKIEYWDALNLNIISDQNVANIIYDGCVNQGKYAMRSILRKSLEENGLKIKDSDVIFSINILNKLNELDQKKLFNSIKKYREERYRNSKTFNIHGKGWLNRLNKLIYERFKI
jgi:lysozyme family protein